MGQILLWIELLAASCLMVTVATVDAARCKQFGFRWAIVVGSILAPLGCWATVTYIAVWMRVVAKVGPPERPWFLATLAGMFVIIALIILLRGMRNRQAAGWPAWKLNLIFAAVCVLSLITFWNLDLTARDRLGRLRDRADSIMAATFPPRIPDSQNAARVYEQAFESLDMATNRKIINWAIPVCKWLDTSEEKQPSSRPSDAKIREILQTNSRGLKQLRRAAGIKQCSFGGYWSSDELLNLLLSEISSMRSAAELLAADARIRAIDGDAAGAIADLNALFAMAEHVTRKPTMITALAAINIETRAAETMEFVLARCDASAAELAALEIEPMFSHVRMISSALSGEEALGLSILATLEEPGHHDIPSRYLPEVLIPMYRVFLMSDEIEGYNVAAGEWQRLAAMPHHKSKALWRTLPQRMRKKQTGFLTPKMMPAVSGYPDRAATGDSRHRLASLATAVTVFRVKTGALPESLDKLIPEYIEAIPTDPFDGEPLRMIGAKDGGAILYSIGPDLKDDGGQALDNNKAGDVVFRLAAKK
jgi:hypothetical protein